MAVTRCARFAARIRSTWTVDRCAATLAGWFRDMEEKVATLWTHSPHSSFSNRDVRREDVPSTINGPLKNARPGDRAYNIARFTQKGVLASFAVASETNRQLLSSELIHCAH